MKVQRSTVIGYFYSKLQAESALKDLGVDASITSVAASSELFANLAQPEEWMLLWVGSEAQAEDIADSLRGGLASAVVVAPIVDDIAKPEALGKRSEWAYAQIQSDWKHQLARLQPERSGTESAQWGITEASFDETAGALSLVEHRYIIEGAHDGLKTYLDGATKNKRLRVTLPRIYELANQAFAIGSKENSEALLRRALRMRLRHLDFTYEDLTGLRSILDLCLMERLAEVLIQERLHRFDTAVAKRASDVLLAVSDQELDAMIERFATMQPPRRDTAIAIIERLGDIPVAQRELARRWNLIDQVGLTALLRRTQVQDEKRLEFFRTQISGLRMVARLDWGLFLEVIDPVYEALSNDPSRTYRIMTFESRLRYRMEVLGLALGASTTELAVVNKALHYAVGSEDKARHIGYYLVGDGRIAFARTIHSAIPVKARLAHMLSARPATTFISLITVFTAVIFALICLLTPSLSWAGLMILFAALLPLSQVGIDLTYGRLRALLPPRFLPEIVLNTDRIAASRLVATVPTMFRSQEGIDRDIRSLEIRYLANREDSIAYGLLSDWSDASSEMVPNDVELLSYAQATMATLQARYPDGKFFIFHRPRIFAPNQMVWMGRERKRGKIEDFLSFIADEKAEGQLVSGRSTWVKGAKYCLTLDADTELPPGTARRMLGIMLHPLNRPSYDAAGRVTSGYGLIQPHIATSYESARESRLAGFYHQIVGVDPYLRSISDGYFDLADDAIYYGKGMYDVELFHRRLHGRLPSDQILSHDLLEGAHIRVGFASNVTLYDAFPQTISELESRQQRWIRGDWQILPWLFNLVPGPGDTKQTNELSPINRWKIFDNMRRSLVAPLTIGYILAAASLHELGLALAILGLQTFLMVILSLRSIRSLRQLGKWLYDLRMPLFELSFLPYRAYKSLSAVICALWRLFITRKLMLQWRTAAEHSDVKSHRDPHLFWNILASIVIILSLRGVDMTTQIIAKLLALLWLIAPALIWYMERPAHGNRKSLTANEQTYLRQLALQTFRFFYELMNAEQHYLPPDNIQIALKREIATRTSPTNIGLGLGAWVEAVEFGFVSPSQALERTSQTMTSLEQLETHNGHFYNWYDTETLLPLPPRFVSTVDSGNFVAALWTFRQGTLAFSDRPVIDPAQVKGLEDLLHEVELRNPAMAKASLEEIRTTLIDLRGVDSNPSQYVVAVQAACNLIIAREPGLTGNSSSAGRSTIERLVESATAIVTELELYLGWYLSAIRPTPMIAQNLTPENKAKIAGIFDHIPSYREIADWDEMHVVELANSSDLHDWLEQLTSARVTSQIAARHFLEQVEQISARAASIADATDFRFLYNPTRRTFHIGYDMENQKLNSSYYDLLASEARTASFIAIAMGQVPVRHWWSLGRNVRVIEGRPTLLSWSGTMFEYLMPQLYFRNYPETILFQTVRNAVAAQTSYAKKLGIPWGISESAHSDLDATDTYQYRAFGAPSLAIQYGPEVGTVVAPYASALAAMVDLPNAMHNFLELDRLGLRGTLGYFEAVDFRRPYRPSGERGLTIFNYMAHHQGMVLHSLSNIVNRGSVVRKFHSDLRVEATRTLLQERQLGLMPKAKVYDIGEVRPLQPLKPIVMVDGTSGLNERLPRQYVLSNGYYKALVLADGTGGSTWGETEINRWSADALVPSGGTLTYIRDTQSGAIWSPTYNPIGGVDESYNVVALPEKVVFERNQEEIISNLEVWVASDADVEVRRLSLTNSSEATKELEVTSYTEFGLAPHAAQVNHPSFNRLFIDTEAIPEDDAILAWRRHRSNDEQPVYIAHLFVNLSDPAKRATLQTDRMTFLGRDSDLTCPKGLLSDIGPITPTVDPIAAIRQTISVRAGATVELAALTIAGKSREEVIKIASRFRQNNQLRRSVQVAWTVAEAELQRLQLSHEEAEVFHRLSSYLTYPNRLLKSAARGLVAGGEHGIVELPPTAPIIIAISETQDLALIRQLYLGAAYLGFRGYPLSLIVLIKQGGDVGRRLHSEIEVLTDRLNGLIGEKLATHVDVMTLAELRPADLSFFLRAAKVVLDAEDGSLVDQLDEIPHLTHPASIPDLPAQQMLPAVAEKVEFENAYGGFIDDAKGYGLSLRHQATPAPWSNVIANTVFGTLVTERGGGFTWAGNSQEARLTPWRNDPANDRHAEAWYVWDQTKHEFWPLLGTKAELPLVNVEHRFGISKFTGQRSDLGYTCEISVPQDGTGPKRVRISRITLTNHSRAARHLTIAATAEMVLGGVRENDQAAVVSSWDEDAEVMLFRTTSAGLRDTVVYSALNTETRDHTSDRAEILGARTLELPIGLVSPELSGRVGAGLDPMSALRTDVVVEPGTTIELVWYLGAANNVSQAVSDVAKLRAASTDTIFAGVTDTWSKLTGQIKVETPERSVDVLLNGWLLYQAISSRLWGRTGYYQSSGAFGFRDQLQDVMGMVYTTPAYVRDHIIFAAHHQFKEGDVQHWWQPHSRWGLRSRISDDRLWLPYVVERYVTVTGDVSILDAVVPYLEGIILPEGQKDAYFEAAISKDEGTILDHCMRAIACSQGLGEHGLPLIGTGDWCDGYDRVGIGGKGESVWMAWFLSVVEEDMARLLDRHSKRHEKTAAKLRQHAKSMKNAAEAHGWDGAWYTRAFYDDSTPLGSATSEEGQIDSLAQSWAIMAGGTELERQHTAIDSALSYLVDRENRVVRLLSPSFDKTEKDPGYIRGYLPGVRENGGQYTHGSIWLAIACAKIGRANDAVDLLQLMNPVLHSTEPNQLARYTIEPYVTAGDVYALPGHAGMGGWSWYTGSAAWYYRAWIENVLGLRVEGNQLSFDPMMPNAWPGFKMTYRYKTTLYHIAVQNESALANEAQLFDGIKSKRQPITMKDDGRDHELIIWVG
jgi:cyclic beta-1,2-glucan synthetase